MRALFIVIAFLCVGGLAVAGASAGVDADRDLGAWWSPGDGKPLPESASYENERGRLSILNVGGPIETRGHAFFEPLGSNGRACVTCHQPAAAMSITSTLAQQRWDATNGKDPLFAAIDGSNCPSLPQEEKSSHSLLLEHGLFRIFQPWPPTRFRRTQQEPEFTIEVVFDPTGCNTDPKYGLNSPTPTVSVYRRPRIAANLTYVVNPRNRFNTRTGMPVDADPETGLPVSMNLMSDARQPTLRTQAMEASSVHLERPTLLDERILQQLTEFELQIYAAQTYDRHIGDLVIEGGPEVLGPAALARRRVGSLGDNLTDPVFGRFDMWREPKAGDERSEFRASVARGYDVFFLRPFWIRDAAHLNSIGLGNPIKRTCSTCHNANMTGQDIAPGFMDIGVANLPWANETKELPVFKLVCDPSVPPHPFLGRTIYTHDPGRALISGKCEDIGSITMQQLRGLAARAPYFSNGSAASLEEVVDFYDRRFAMRLTEREKRDLANFLSVL